MNDSEDRLPAGVFPGWPAIRAWREEQARESAAVTEEALARWILRLTVKHKDEPLDAAQIGLALGRLIEWATEVVARQR